MAVFILQTDYQSGRTWASLFSASDNSSLKTNYLRCASVKMYNLICVYKYGHKTDNRRHGNFL